VEEATRGARVLLADDNADMRDYVRKLLVAHHEVEAVADGEAALAAARERRPDLVLTDVMTPKLDGLGLLRTLRADPRLKTVPVILLSARAGEEARVEGLEAGADDYLIKPFSARELLARVGAHVRRAWLQSGATEVMRASDARSAAEANALARLNEASSRLWRMRSLREGLEEMLAATIDLLGADMGNIQLLDPSRGVLVIAAQRGFEQEFLDFFREVSTADESACGRTLRSGQRTVIEDVETDPPYAPLRSVARAAGYRSVQSTPLIGRDGTPLGMLSTHFRVPHQPSEQDLRRLDLYVRQAADFIERCRTDEALQEVNRRKDEFLAMLAHELRNPLAPIPDGSASPAVPGAEGTAPRAPVRDHRPPGRAHGAAPGRSPRRLPHHPRHGDPQARSARSRKRYPPGCRELPARD